jgi:hypothetical protein
MRPQVVGAGEIDLGGDPAEIGVAPAGALDFVGAVFRVPSGAKRRRDVPARSDGAS